MKEDAKTKLQPLLEMEGFRTRPDATERRLQEDSEILQVQIDERNRAEEIFAKAQEYTNTLRASWRQYVNRVILLTPALKVISANRFFYETFQVMPEETKERFIFDIGNQQFDIPEFFLWQGNEFLVY